MQDDKGGYRQINKSLNICAFYDYLEGQTARLPQLANVEQLTPNVLRILGQNPGKVNSLLLPTSLIEIWLLILLCNSRSKGPIHISSARAMSDSSSTPPVASQSEGTWSNPRSYL